MQKKLMLWALASLLCGTALAQGEVQGADADLRQQMRGMRGANDPAMLRQMRAQREAREKKEQEEWIKDAAQKEKKTVYMVSDAHLDTQWNWDIQTTIREYIPKTIRQNLHLLKKYPSYIFNFEGAIKYAWMKEYFPNEYEEVKKYIANGRWHLTGTSWDATETIISSSESLIRNTMLGQQFFRDEYGKESTDFFLPDCFGFPYNYPTIAAHCGVIGFSSQKLQWRNNKFYDQKLEKYPFSVGLWEGVDGSRIMMTHGYSYNQRYRDDDLSLSRSIYREMSEAPTGVGYRYYGTGDTGGSPDITTVRALDRTLREGGKGPLKVISATSDQIYKDYLPYESHPELPSFKGELYMDVHGVGCYTSQAAMKLYNRQNEHLADAAERSSVVAEWLGRKAYPGATLTEVWKSVLLHQFHDDLPGTSIPRAYEFSWNDEIIDMKRFSDVTRNAVSGVAELLNTQVSGTPLVLFNPEGFAQNTVADVILDDMADAYSVTDAKGKAAASQVVVDARGRKHLLINATVPAMGFAVYSVKPASGKASRVQKSVSTLENSVYRLTFDQNGNLSSLLDKRYNKELVESGKAIGLVVFTDCDSKTWPAWEILKKTVDGPYTVVSDGVSVTLVEDGSLRKTVKVTKRYGESEIAQYVSLYEGALADRIDFYNEVEWKSLNSLLKCDFPLSISNPMATYDLGIGSVDRCNNETFKYEVYSHEWTDLTDKSGDYGVTFINNCKYGWDKPADNQLRLSLLWSPEVGRSYAYQNRQDFGHHEFTYSLIGHKGALDKGKAVEQSTLLNSPIRAYTATKHKGQLGKEFSFAASDNSNVSIRAFKKAEVGSEYVLRVYENSGNAQKANITFAAPIASAMEADGTEVAKGNAQFSGKQLKVDIPAYSVRTYRIRFADQNAVAAMPQTSIQLPWNRRCFSYNGFRAEGSFSDGYSYAAELMPADGLTVDGVKFSFQDMDAASGYACLGDTIQLPQGQWNRIYFLAAATGDDAKASLSFLVPGKKGAAMASAPVQITVPSYTGFIGQWGHEGQGQGFVKDAQVAYVGTHRHSSQGDAPYEFTYMFKYGVDIPAGATHIIMPKESHVVVFSMNAVNEPALVGQASRMFVSGNISDELKAEAETRFNLLKDATLMDCSGHVNDREAPKMLVDGDPTTKWCDTSTAPNYVSFDLGAEHELSAWYMLNAGSEGASYITRAALLQVKADKADDWKTVDMIDGNRENSVRRQFSPVKARYVRLYITGPAQSVGHDACRVYELGVY